MSKVQNSQSRQFVISTIGDADRIDCHYFDPVYFNMIEKIEEIAKSSGFDVQTLEKLLDREVKPNFGAGETPLGAPYIPEGIPFVRIQNVDETGLDLSDVVFLPKQIYDHMHRWKLRAEDVAGDVAISRDCFGTLCLAMTRGN